MNDDVQEAPDQQPDAGRRGETERPERRVGRGHAARLPTGIGSPFSQRPSIATSASAEIAAPA